MAKSIKPVVSKHTQHLVDAIQDETIKHLLRFNELQPVDMVNGYWDMLASAILNLEKRCMENAKR